MGRRVKVVKSNGQSVAHRQTFSYNGYLQIQRRTQETETPQAFHMDQFIWDPTDPIATRPLLWNRNNATSYYTHDGSKNVSEVVVENGDNAAHYEYAPFGTATMRSGAAAANPWRFSSEFIDDMLGLVYYNFRHYEPVMGRWLQWDPIDTMHYLLWRSVVGKSDVSSLNLSGYIENAPNCRQDKLGLTIVVNPVISKCCRKGDQYRSVYGFLSTPCCNKDETEVPSHECGCRACGERVKSHAEDVDGCIGDPGMDGYGDAFRHCYASCVMARTCGRFCAFAGGWYHELETPSEFFGREAWQDVANNSRGRDLASRGIDCLNGCLDLLYSGQLTVFNRQNRPFSREQAEECFNRNNARNQ
jgi:RHS repeat-associated protein